MKVDALGIPEGPPWNVDVVADVHAGVYPPEPTAELLRKMADDPDAAAILAALDSTVDDLSLLPEIGMPRQYVQRLDDAIAAEFAALDSLPASPARTSTGTDVVRGQFGALLAQGAPTAPAGLARPDAPAQRATGPVLPRQTDPSQPLPRRQPMIPRVLPTAPQAPASPQAPAAGGGPQQTRPPAASAPASNVHPLAGARQERPAVGRPPTGPGATGPQTAKPNGPSRVGSLEAQRIKRRRWTGGLLAAAAVGALAIGVTFAVNDSNPDSGIAGEGSPAPTVPAPGAGDNGDNAGGSDGLEAFVLEPGKFGDKLPEIEGAAVTNGSLSDTRTFTSCLAANDIDGGAVSGITEVTFEGQQAYAIAVNLDANTVEVVVVGTSCGVDGDAATLDRETVTR